MGLTVPWQDRCAMALDAALPRLGPALARLETRALTLEGELPVVRAPVFVCGMARSGSTLLLELLSRAPGFTSFRYADLPGLWTPYAWNRLRARLPRPATPPQPRAHDDGILVTRESPEAFEEIYWHRFFPGRLDPAVNQILEAQDRASTFNRFYTEQIAKLLAARGAQRYLSKANYHLTRIGYLLDLFPDARFVIPLRHPRAHIASLLRQDARFMALHDSQPAVARHMARIGHREFGPGKRAVQVGDADAAAHIQSCYDRGDAEQGFLAQWTALHRWLLHRLQGNRQLSQHCLVVDHDQLTLQPGAELGRLAQHVLLDTAVTQTWVHSSATQIRHGSRGTVPANANETSNWVEAESLWIALVGGFAQSGDAARVTGDC